MFNIRVKKFVLFIGIITILFAVYHLSNSVSRNDYTKESIIISEIENSHLDEEESKKSKSHIDTFYFNNNNHKMSERGRDFDHTTVIFCFVGLKAIFDRPS